jgi:hypothetical protein
MDRRREEPVAGSPELASLAYGPLVLVSQLGRDGLSREMIEGRGGPDLDKLPPLPLPTFETGLVDQKATPSKVAWVKKTDEGELRFRTVDQARDFELKPIYQVLDERYSVYWQRVSKA